MAIFIDDPKHGTTVRLRCVCGAGPVRLSELDGSLHAVIAACGAHERLLPTGTVLVLAECRARERPKAAKRKR